MEDPPQYALGAPDSQNFIRASVSKKRTIMFAEHGLGILQCSFPPKHTHLLLVGAEEAQVRAEWMKMLAGKHTAF